MLAWTLALLVLPALASAASCTVTSNGTGGGDWDTDTTWAGNHAPPVATDIVCITSTDTVIASGGDMASDVSVAGGGAIQVAKGATLTLSSTVTSGSTLDGQIEVLDGGTLNLNNGIDLAETTPGGGGALMVDAGGALAIDTGIGATSIAVSTMPVGGTVTSNGPVTVDAFNSGGGAGGWNITSGAVTLKTGGFGFDQPVTDGAAKQGSLTLDGASFTTTASTAAIDVNQLDLKNNAGVDFSTGGNGSYVNAGTISLEVTAATFEVDAPLTAGVMTVDNSPVGSTAVLMNSADWHIGTLHWNAGELQTGSFASGFAIVVGTLDMSQSTATRKMTVNLTVSGTATWSNGNFDFNGGTLKIGSGARFNIDTDGVDFVDAGGGGHVVNDGVLDKRVGGGLGTNIAAGITVDSPGEIDVDQLTGALNINGTFSQWDGVATLTGGTYVLNGPLSLVPGVATITSIGSGANVQLVSDNGQLITNAGDIRTTLVSNAAGATLEVASGGTFTPPSNFTNDGTLIVNGTMDLSGKSLTINAGTLGGTGTIKGDVSSAGTVSPGNSPGTLTITGNYAQSATGVLKEEVAGPGTSQYDRLIVSGTATLDGTLTIVPLGGYVAPNGQAFDVITAASRTGTFATVNEPAGTGGAFYDLAYGGGSPALRLTGNSVSVGDVTQAEGNSGTTPYTFTIALGQAAPAAAAVDWATRDGSATAGSDYQAASGTVTFAPGETVKTVTVVVNGDTAVEPDENFDVNLSNPQGTRIARATAIGTITNDDAVVATPAAVPPPVPADDIDGFAIAPPPVQGKAVNVKPVSGTVLVKLPGKTKFVKLPDEEQVPVGTIVDARKGVVRLFSVGKKGKVQSAIFYQGIFQVLQKKGQALTREKLVLGSFTGCPKASRANAAATKRKRLKPGSTVRQLWGSGSGEFRTEGKFASASIRGTKWLTADRCDGTLIRVAKGAVTVRDATLKKTFALKAPNKYLAPALKPKKH